MSKRKNDEPKLSLTPCKLKSDSRGGRSSRLGMFINLFAMVWAPIFALFQFLAILGLVVGAGTVFVGVLGGVGLLVLVGWFVVNLLQDATSWSDKSYRAWRKDGGDPYFDLTWFWPLNSDSDEVRRGKGYIVCPNPECGGTFSARRRNCDHCGMDHMDFLRCGACGTSIFDPDRKYDEPCGIGCPGCRRISRSPSLAHLPVESPLDYSLVAKLRAQQDPGIFEG